MKHAALATLSLTTLLLASCGTNAPKPTNPNTTSTQVNGKLLAPDGKTPIANALVYAPDSTVAQVQSQAQTLPCGTPPNASWAATCTGADGTFNLKAKTASSTFKVVFKKGSFEAEAQVNAQNGQANLGNVKLESDPTKGAPKMAVVTGTFDRIQDVLAKLGFGALENGQLKLGTEKFDLFSGDFTQPLPEKYLQIEALFKDGNDAGTQADIFNYDIVFFNCGAKELLEQGDVNTLKAYVQAGGKIYASDWAYDYIEQAFPEYLDFYGGDETPENQAEPVDEAVAGPSSVLLDARVDPVLKAWLQGMTCKGESCLTAEGKVRIDDDLGGWALTRKVHPGKTSAVKVWAYAPAQWEGAGNGEEMPLMETFSVGQGKVLYTTHHTHTENETEVLPQERLLEFMVFEL